MEQHHQRILDAAAAAASSSTREQILRYGPSFFEWCEARGRQFSVEAAAALRMEYLATLERHGAFRDPQARKFAGWIVNRLSRAAETLEARASSSHVPTNARTRLLDGLIPHTPLDRVVQQVLADAANDTRRAVLRCDVGLFLAWCRAEGRDPAAVEVAELERYRRWIRAQGHRAEAPLVTARRIVRTLNPPRVWW